MSASSVVVIGGGLAGLAATSALAERGIRVTLFESRPMLGGRASSFVDGETGETIDNCQHVAMGCCTNYLHFCETIGVDDWLERQTELHFVDSSGAISRFRPSSWLPAPLHLLPALRGLKFLSGAERREIARGLKLLAKLRQPQTKIAYSPELLAELGLTREQLDDQRQSQRDDWPFDKFLDMAGQSESVRKKFWDIILVSALSEETSNVTLRYGAQVFLEGFVANRNGWEVYLPKVPLDDLYSGKLMEWMTSHGTEIRCGTGVKELVEAEHGVIRAVKLRDGTEVNADQFVLAVPWHRVLDLVPSSLQIKYEFLKEIVPAPISSVHLWFDRKITELPHLVFVDHLSQWLFDRTRFAEGSAERGYYYQVVISASRLLQGRPRDEVIARVCDELRRVLPDAANAKLLRSRLVTEHKAVFSPRPGIDRLRPRQETAYDNLYLAGDWTASGWPATMEGAVRSGYLAAESLLSKIGRPDTVVQPDLPVALLSRWLFKL